MSKIFLVLLATCFADVVFGQFTHYSLYRMAEPRVNPAYYATGTDATLDVLYRNQQSTPSVKQTSTYLSARYPFLRRKSPWSAVGIEMARDTEGLEGIFETTTLGGAYALNVPLKPLQSISLGVSANYFWRNVNTERLFTGSQFIDGLGFDPTVDNGEVGNDFNARLLSIALGVRWQRTDKKANPRSHLGIALYNANVPSDEFIRGDGERLPAILMLEGAQRVHQGRNWSIDAEVNYRLEQTRSFIIAGGTATLDLYRFNAQLRDQTLGFKVRYLQRRGIAPGIVWDTPAFALAAGYDIPLMGTVAHDGAFEVAMRLKKPVRAKTKRNKRSVVPRRPVRPTRRTVEDEDALTILGDPTPDSVAIEAIPPADSLQGEPMDLSGVEVVIIEFEFEFGSAVPIIDNDVLEQVVKRMEDDPTLKIEIVGHTDNVGSRSYNQNLSEDRALALFEMLVAMGVEEERMSYS
ncbi:MAG: PorP/SprF family type IX secretion system membrane protein, partial [Bacteroidota bacterium]